MHKRTLGKSGISASVVGIGTWVTGGWMWGGVDKAQAVDAIRAAIDAGITLIDTAPVYGFGLSEELVGEAVAGRRDKVILATKCGLVWSESQGEFFFASDDHHPNQQGPIRVYRNLRPDSIRREVEQSLRRLNTDVIDLYQTHWQDSTTPIEETMAVLMDLRAEGKIRAVGCSNATPTQMQAYRDVGQLDADQELFSMLDRDQEKTNLPYCAKHAVAFLAYSPLAQGLLTGKVTTGRDFSAGDQRAGKKRFTPEALRSLDELLSGLDRMAREKECTMAQLVLAWTLTRPGCSHVLAGARTREQAVENARAGKVLLSGEETAALTRLVESVASRVPGYHQPA